jgi:hypothetical protein
MRLPRLEWISLLYLAFFVLAVATPGLVRDTLWGVPEEQVEGFLIFCFGLAGLASFSVYERLMERKEREREQALTDRDRVRKELVSSYEYIGAVNRRMESLKDLANETAIHLIESDRLHKGVFQSIAAGAAAAARADRVAIRIVSLDGVRTIREFLLDNDAAIHVPNRELRAVHDSEKSHGIVDLEDGSRVLVVPSSRRDLKTKAFILISLKSEMDGVDIGLLNVYANQAEVLYRILAARQG